MTEKLILLACKAQKYCLEKMYSQINNIPMSNDTICRRTNYISDHIQQQLERELSGKKLL